MPLAGFTTHTSAHGHTNPSLRNQSVRAEILFHMVRQAYRKDTFPVKSLRCATTSLFGLVCSSSLRLDAKRMSIATTVGTYRRLCAIQAVIDNAICAKGFITADWTFLWGLGVLLHLSSTFGTLQTHYSVSVARFVATRCASDLRKFSAVPGFSSTLLPRFICCRSDRNTAFIQLFRILS